MRLEWGTVASASSGTVYLDRMPGTAVPSAGSIAGPLQNGDRVLCALSDSGTRGLSVTILGKAT